MMAVEIDVHLTLLYLNNDEKSKDFCYSYN